MADLAMPRGVLHPVGGSWIAWLFRRLVSQGGGAGADGTGADASWLVIAWFWLPWQRIPSGDGVFPRRVALTHPGLAVVVVVEGFPVPASLCLGGRVA